MGCDIHFYSEHRQPGGWVADRANTFEKILGDPTDPSSEYFRMGESYPGGRNYWLFGLLCKDVRAAWPESFKEKGLPDDTCSEIRTLYQQFESDAHSMSWLTLKELQEKAVELLISPTEQAPDLLSSLQSLVENLPPHNGDPEHQRVVFWFDN